MGARRWWGLAIVHLKSGALSPLHESPPLSPLHESLLPLPLLHEPLLSLLPLQLDDELSEPLQLDDELEASSVLLFPLQEPSEPEPLHASDVVLSGAAVAEVPEQSQPVSLTASTTSESSSSTTSKPTSEPG